MSERPNQVCEASECIRGARGNSMHTLQLVGMPQCDPFTELSQIPRHHMLWIQAAPILIIQFLSVPFIEDLGSSIYENNGPSSV